ncbi:hypothetical protein JVX90_13685 [Gordonia sp. PDNC005]|uniref:hypothetical protein n=1 Tax=Gordonia sp. PDNC005 TaxID=2811424 RepID=UPI0019642622|nr:hypothetical protein [Gordonia sp. PDNC005]QRY61463.1 hypothetical protein JVX90_13685 [Gordonia sp. PDNC005]
MAITYFGTQGTVTESTGAGRWARAGVPFMVRTPDDFKVTAVTGLQRTVQVAAGSALVCGVSTVETAARQLQLAANTGSQVRLDLVVLRLVWAGLGASTAVLDIKQGTPGAVNPPTPTRTPGTVYEAPLAVVRVAPNTGQLTGSAVFPIAPYGGKGGPLHALQAQWIQLVDAPVGTELVTDTNAWRYCRLADGSWSVIESNLQPWSTWTPQLTSAGGGNIVLGTGGIMVGRYKIIRNMLYGEFEIRKGTSGSDFRWGNISVALPVPVGTGTTDRWCPAHLATPATGLMDWRAQVLCSSGATSGLIFAALSSVDVRMRAWRSAASSPAQPDTGYPRIVNQYTEGLVVTGQLRYIVD